MPYVCYIDEAGCATPVPGSVTNVQPVLAISGLILDFARLPNVTVEFLRLKRKYHPGKFKSAHHLDDVRQEIKGSDIRSRMRKQGYHAMADLKFLDETLDLLMTHGSAFFATIWVKGIKKPFKARPVYTRSIQMACENFQEFLADRNDVGFMVADFRTTQLNDQVAHSIFTQKFRAKGDPYPRILELPTFGISNNHVGLQISDLLCSSLLFPIATSSYCWGYIAGVHVHPRDLFIKRRYVRRVKLLQYRYNKGGKIGGGVWVGDAVAHRTSAHFFQLPPVKPKPMIAPAPIAPAYLPPSV